MNKTIRIIICVLIITCFICILFCHSFIEACLFKPSIPDEDSMKFHFSRFELEIPSDIVIKYSNTNMQVGGGVAYYYTTCEDEDYVLQLNDDDLQKDEFIKDFNSELNLLNSDNLIARKVDTSYNPNFEIDFKFAKRDLYNGELAIASLYLAYFSETSEMAILYTTLS